MLVPKQVREEIVIAGRQDPPKCHPWQACRSTTPRLEQPCGSHGCARESGAHKLVQGNIRGEQVN
jgi:hypothetical protein